MRNIVYEKVLGFKKRYPLTISWRLKAHSNLAYNLINKDEEVLYAFAAQKDPSAFNIFSTFVVWVPWVRGLHGGRARHAEVGLAACPELYNLP